MKDMKLLMENWRTYVEKLDYEEPKVYLFESGKKPVQKNLSFLFNESKKEILSEEEVLETWRKSVLYESQQLINENVFKALKDGWNAIQKGGRWLTEKAMAAYAWAMTKINNFINNVWGGINLALIKAVESAKANMYIRSVLEDLSSMKEKILDLKSEHPAAFKAVTIMTATGALLAAMAVFSADAHALIKDGKTVVSLEELNGIKGVLSAACADDPSVCRETKDAIRTINDYASKAQAAPGAGAGVDASEVLNLAKKSSDDTVKVIKSASKWWDILQDTVANYAEEVKAEIQPTMDAMKSDPSSVSKKDVQAVIEKMEVVNRGFEDLKQIAETGEKSTFRTLERIVLKGEGFYQSSVKMGGELPKTSSGMASAYGEPLAKGIEKVLSKGK